MPRRGYGRHVGVAILVGAIPLLFAACGSATPSSAPPGRGTAASTTAPPPSFLGTTTTTTTTRPKAPTTTTKPKAPTTTTRAKSGSSTTRASQPHHHGAPKGGPVPSGFETVSYTVVSPSEFFLLGTVPCA
ncbi:MAG TPA: hypothetical protein VKR78_02270, partial [Acidimicrobiales bacterium]|nr:hypothetical protein [Acidimicrobiales bacterium]